MARHIVLGAGPIGRLVAEMLVADGHDVTVVTRSGTTVEGARSLAMAATDPALRDVVDGACGLVVATNPPYPAWGRQWPPVIRNVIEAVDGSDVGVVLVGNLYGHPRGSSPMTADTPLDPPTRKGAVRVQIWHELLAAHESGRLRAAEVRASDYVGREAVGASAHAGRLLLTPVLAGRTASVVGDPDAVHSWTAVADIARTTVAVLGDPSAWGRGWVVPTAAPRSIRAVAEDMAAAAGVPSPRVRQIPRVLLRALGLVIPTLREIVEVTYQFDETFVSDGQETTDHLGIVATPWEETIFGTVEAAAGRTREPRP